MARRTRTMTPFVSRLLREKRKGLGLTQAEISSFSEKSAQQYEREFVAKIETAGIPQTARKFLSYARHVGIDINLAAELELLDPKAPTPKKMPTWGVLTNKIRRLAADGETDDALGWAALHFAEAENQEDDDQAAVALLNLGIVCEARSLWTAARHFAESALRIGLPSDGDTVLANVLIARCYLAIGLPNLALALVSSVADLEVELPGIALCRLYGVEAQAYAELGDDRRAIKWYARAAQEAEALEAHGCAARALALAAVSYARLEDTNRCRDTANEAIEMLDGSRGGDRAFVLAYTALAVALAGEEDSQIQAIRAAKQARSAGDEGLEFVANVARALAALNDGDKTTFRAFRRELQRSVQRSTLGADVRGLFDELILDAL